MLPLVSRLPARTGLGDQPFGVDRGDHMVVYLPVPEHQRQAWRSPATGSHTADYQEAGANLAANVFAMLRLEDFRATTAQSPYSRLRRLLSALDGTEIVAGGQGFRFADPPPARRYASPTCPEQAAAPAVPHPWKWNSLSALAADTLEPASRRRRSARFAAPVTCRNDATGRGFITRPRRELQLRIWSRNTPGRGPALTPSTRCCGDSGITAAGTRTAPCNGPPWRPARRKIRRAPYRDLYVERLTR
jgi:hypothetical protein